MSKKREELKYLHQRVEGWGDIEGWMDWVAEAIPAIQERLHFIEKFLREHTTPDQPPIGSLSATTKEKESGDMAKQGQWICRACGLHLKDLELFPSLYYGHWTNDWLEDRKKLSQLCRSDAEGCGCETVEWYSPDPPNPSRQDDDMSPYVGLYCEVRDVGNQWFPRILAKIVPEGVYGPYVTGESSTASYWHFCRPHPQTLELIAAREEIEHQRQEGIGWRDQWQEADHDCHGAKKEIERLQKIADWHEAVVIETEKKLGTLSDTLQRKTTQYEGTIAYLEDERDEAKKELSDLALTLRTHIMQRNGEFRQFEAERDKLKETIKAVRERIMDWGWTPGEYKQGLQEILAIIADTEEKT